MTEQDDMAVRAVIEKTRRVLRVPPSVPDSALPVFAEQVAGQRDMFRDQRDSLDEKRHELLAELDALSDLVAEADGIRPCLTFDELRCRVRALADDAGRWRKLGAAGQATPEMLAQAWLRSEVEESIARGQISVMTAEGVDQPEDQRRMVDDLTTDWDPESKPHDAHVLSVARRALENLRVVPSVSLLPVTAVELARAVHEARSDLTRANGRPPVFLPVEWSKLDGGSREWFERVAARALDRLPSYVAPKAGVAPESPAAVRAVREIAQSLGMSFGDSDDVEAISQLTVEAVRQRVEGSAPSGTGAHLPGTFHVTVDGGKVEQGRDYLFTGALKGKPLARLDGPVAAALERLADPVDADKAALLEQVQALGEELQALHGVHARRDARFARLRELIGLEGGGESGEDAVVESIAATFGDFNARLPKLAKDNRRLRRRNKELRVELSAALGIEGLSNVELVRRGRELFNVEQEFEQFRRDLARTMVSESMRPEALLWTAQQMVSFERRHAVCQGAAALERELVGQLAEVAGLSPESGWTWRPLLERVQADLESGRRAAQAVADRHEDLSRATGRADASWEELIELVTGLAAQTDREAWADVNALAKIREVLGLRPKLFRAGVVDQVKDLRDTRARMEGQLWRVLAELGATGMHVNAATERALEVIKELRTKQADRNQLVRWVDNVALTLAESAGIRIGDSVEVMMQKAGDAAAILRSWPDVARAAEQMDGQDFGELRDRPDEVAQRLADLVRGLNTGRVPMWASFTEQIAARFESMVRLRPDADDPDFLVMAELEPLHKATLLHAATQVRAHGAALVVQAENLARFRDSVGTADVAQPIEPAKTITVLRQNQHWTTGGTVLSDPDAPWHIGCGGQVTLSEGTQEGVCGDCGLLCVPQSEPMVSRTVVEFQDRPQELEWSHGPTADDPDPGKRWHTGCGGEVLTFDGVDVCQKCGREDEVQAAEAAAEANADAESES